MSKRFWRTRLLYQLYSRTRICCRVLFLQSLEYYFIPYEFSQLFSDTRKELELNQPLIYWYPPLHGLVPVTFSSTELPHLTKLLLNLEIWTKIAFCFISMITMIFGIFWVQPVYFCLLWSCWLGMMIWKKLEETEFLCFDWRGKI